MRTYFDFEMNLPEYLEKDITEYLKGIREKSSILDCLFNEVQGSINLALYSNDITSEEAEVLRKTYIYSENLEIEDAVDFSKCQINILKMYGGANGNKIGINFENKNYMLKFPPNSKLNLALNYSNSCISEYVACHIFKLLGIEVQETILGNYGNKEVVACKDFEIDGYRLFDFAQLKNTIINSESNGYSTDLEDILQTIDKQNILPASELRKYFWEMFIVDALLGNFDRHNGNWGILTNEITGDIKIAPIYDCGSCLYPQLDNLSMKNILENQKEIDKRIYIYPTSSIKYEDKKINYLEFISSNKYKECSKALVNISSKINLVEMNSIIDNTPFMSNIHKQFLKIIIRERKEKILDRSLEIIKEKEIVEKRIRDIEER